MKKNSQSLPGCVVANSGIAFRLLALFSSFLATLLTSIPPQTVLAAVGPCASGAICDSHQSYGRVSVGSRWINYAADAGSISVQASTTTKATAMMSYVAYFATNHVAARRPIIFLFNGGPGASSLWLQVAAFGPRRVLIDGTHHVPPAPYTMVNNADSLLDVGDLVFIDAPGTGFGSALSGEAAKTFFSVDGDAQAFADFISQFLSRYNRTNSPKFLLGESYGTMRAAILANILQSDRNIDLNGLILLSSILSYNLSDNLLAQNPGFDQAYITLLPSYASTAWYHNRLAGGGPADLDHYLAEVQGFAAGEYSRALAAGSTLSDTTRVQVAERLALYTGLSKADILQADLRIDPGVFQTHLETGSTISRLDTRFVGPSMEAFAETPDYDPQAAAVTSALLSAYEGYAQRDLGYGPKDLYRIDGSADWTWTHRAPGARIVVPWIVNAMPDLAAAMKYNPYLQVSVHAGLYDLATPFSEAQYELTHLPISGAAGERISFHTYAAGHQLYLDGRSLQNLHDHIAHFVNAASDK